MLDYKKLALEGAALGAIAGFFLGSRRKSLGHFAKYAAMGGVVAVGGGFAMKELGGHKLLAAGDFTGWEDWQPREYWRRY
jgi:hypothetical protein